ncbi:SDR family NAD(P)-dependent oxidoreductase [Rhodopseudomonas palustris]|uniref:Short-chain dehydrogenase/reductase SDR n=1 Tax=Rhodopseudomonas palustris (strain BisB18) TaxID=316056 RepID=Q20YP6_RHOPB
MSHNPSLASQNALIVGATSRLAQAIAVEYAQRRVAIELAGRDAGELARIAADLAIRHGATVRTQPFDALSNESIDALAAELLGRDALPSDLVFVIGYAENLEQSHRDVALAAQLLATNYAAIVRLLTQLMPRLESSRDHRIAFVGSVAGDRGRRTNFVYGAAKAALAAYAQGLRARLLPTGSQVLTIKLGYMDTRLAFGKTPGLITPQPRTVARSILAAMDRNAMVVYVPWYWRPIMTLLRLLPEAIFIRLPLP